MDAVTILYLLVLQTFLLMLYSCWLEKEWFIGNIVKQDSPEIRRIATYGTEQDLFCTKMSFFLTMRGHFLKRKN